MKNKTFSIYFKRYEDRVSKLGNHVDKLIVTTIANAKKFVIDSEAGYYTYTKGNCVVEANIDINNIKEIRIDPERK